MIGAIIGDIIGSVYEFNNIKTKDFELFSNGSRFTDDTVMTIATIDALLDGNSFAECYRKWYRKYPEAGYGRGFQDWARSDRTEPYRSWGNGSAMRVSPIGAYYLTIEEVLSYSQQSAAVTHNHSEGMKGAQAAAAAVFYARTGKTKKQIKESIEEIFHYDLNEPLASIREWYQFDVSCQGSVPQAMIAFLESKSFEDAIRNAVSIGGDSDTIACITGAIAEAYYKDIPEKMKEEALDRLDQEMRNLLETFYKHINI